MNAGTVLDAGPLLQLDHNDRQVVALLARSRTRSAPLIVPGTALAQAMRNPARQARLSRLLRQPLTTVAALDQEAATRVGQLLGTSGTADIADAHVVVCARRAGYAVATSDPDDIHTLDPTLTLITV